MLLDTDATLPTEDMYGRNFINGRWVFPAAPYDFEIRSPSDSSVLATVPLSSHNDVNGAIAAARQSQRGDWAHAATRRYVLVDLLDWLAERAPELAELQCAESGLSPEDSAVSILAAMKLARTLVTESTGPVTRQHGGVSGHILSWGLPFTEMLTSVVGSLATGMSAVVKPSLRGPLSPVAVAMAASHTGLPPGVLNLVQGTGVDVGAALISSPELDRLHVHGNRNTLARARRAGPRTGVPLTTPSVGGNAAIVSPETAPGQIASMAAKAAAALRIHSTGGLFGQSIVAAHSRVAPAVLDALVDALSDITPAPLPSDPIRQRAIGRLGALCAGGAQVLLGGKIPDDIEHRMGWRIPPVVVDLGDSGRAADLLTSAGDPLGPILTVVRWTTDEDLEELFGDPLFADSYGSVWGDGFVDDFIRFGAMARSQIPIEMACDGKLPAAWSGRQLTTKRD